MDDRNDNLILLPVLLGLKNPFEITTGFDRKNLFFAVKRPQNKQKELLAIVSEHKNQSGIIYCATRKNVEKVSDFLNENGYDSLIYHAGLSNEIRSKNQDDFINDRCNLIVATNAFGMGIDKPDVRFVVHYNMPKNLENYYQEAGRAGRDGENSDCVLLYSPGDVHTQKFFIENNDENAELTEEQREKIKKNDYYKLNKMVCYCTSNTCLRNYILNYFGEYHTNECKNCSACLKEYKLTDVTVDSQKILSCIIKTRQRYGASTIIDVLAGSKKESIINAGLDEQSTYGIMSKTKKAAISELITKLIDEEYIHQTEGKYPILEVTQKSYPILKGQKSLTMRLAVKEELHRKIQHTEVDKVLFDKLKERRKYLADKASVPPYVIFSDASLRDMCAKLPTNENDFLRISGVGIKKQEKYAKEFIPIIKEYKEEKF
jgi:ATP-dependent DNA helicase RecQ